jgi:hypothetical protein
MPLAGRLFRDQLQRGPQSVADTIPLRFTSEADRTLLDAVRHPVDGVDAFPGLDARRLFDHAERHGLAGVLLDRCRARSVSLAPELERDLALRDAARECDHAAHLEMLRRIDTALSGLPGVVLKGALLAERLYERPSTRPTTDIDLLVRETDLDKAADALRAVGYRRSEAESETHFRNEGHHLHLLREGAPCVELHFHAFRGFGGTLRSEPLIERSISVPTSVSDGRGAFSELRVLSAEDELVYLATHAAGHRFMRFGWLYDLSLLVTRFFDDARLDRAVARASAAAVTRPFALAMELVNQLFATPTPDLSTALQHRRLLLDAITEEPQNGLARSATRFAYSVALCEDFPAIVRYARGAIRYRANQTFFSR